MQFRKHSVSPKTAIIFSGIVLLALSICVLLIEIFKTDSIVVKELQELHNNFAILDEGMHIERTVYNGSQIKIIFGKTLFNKFFRADLQGTNEFTINYFQNDDFLTSQKIHTSQNDFRVKDFGYFIEVPELAVASGYDEIIIIPHYRFDLKLSLEDKNTIDIDHGQKTYNIAELIAKTPANFYILMAVRDEGTNALSWSTKNGLAAMGSRITDLGYRDSYAAIFHHGRVIAEDMAKERPVTINGENVAALKEVLEDTGTSILVKSAGYVVGDTSAIVIDGEDFSENKRGHNFVVLNQNLEFVDAFNIDTFSRDTIVEYEIDRLLVSQYKNFSLGDLMGTISPRFTALIATNGNFTKNISASTRKFFSRSGSGILQTTENQSYVGVFKNNEVLAEISGNGRQVLSGFDIPQINQALGQHSKDIMIVSSADSNKPALFIVNGENIALDSPGINIVLLGSQFETLGKYSFDTQTEDINEIATVFESEDRMASFEQIRAEDTFSSANKIRLEIAPDIYQKFFELRDQALFDERITSDKKIEWPATVYYQNKKYKANIRFKGDWLDHLNTEKWSYRITLKGDNAIMGMKRFSIQHPKTRSFLYEWIVHEAYREEGGIAPRYDFVSVDINNKNFGIYAIEEHFDKRMIEYHGRREGPILKFDETVAFNSTNAFHAVLPDHIQLANKWNSVKHADINVYQEDKTLRTKNLRENYVRAYALLDGFRSKKLKPSEVFDVDAYTNLIAISDLFQTWHSVTWHNMRFYYNPITDRLEPILFDASGDDRGFETICFLLTSDQICNYVFQDPDFVRAYFRKLEKLAQFNYLDDFKERHSQEISNRARLLTLDRGSYGFSWSRYYQRQGVIRGTLYEGDPLSATVEKVEKNILTVSISNSYKIPYEIGDLRIGNMRHPNPAAGKFIQRSEKNHLIQYDIGSEVDTNLLASTLLSIDFKVPGTKSWRSFRVLPFPDPLASFEKGEFIRDQSNLGKYDFLLNNTQDKIITLPSGNWEIRSDIRIPSGYQFVINNDVRLNLLNGAKLISFSPISAVGSKENPIIIESSDKSSQGIITINTNGSDPRQNQRSILKYVKFSNLKNPSDKGWGLPGSVTFYNSDVNITECIFTSNHAEDALNIISSEYLIADSEFSNTFADAFDSDFSDGMILNSHFKNTGNDAIDFSGSKVTVRDTKVTNAGDKGVSAGEQSTIELYNVVIDGAEIGIASKDKSKVTGRSVSIEQALIGLAGYQKKAEYGPAYINLKESYLNPDLSLPYIDGMGSKIFLNNEQVYLEKKKKRLILRKINDDTLS